MTDEELLGLLRDVLAHAENDAKRYRAAIAALDDIDDAPRACRTCGRPGELYDGLCIDGCDTPMPKQPAPRAKSAAKPNRNGRSLKEAAATKAPCQHCGREYSIMGLATHEKACQRRQERIKAKLAPHLPDAPVAKPPDVPSGLGPIERRPFDPERARLAAVDGAFNDVVTGHASAV